MDPTADAPRKLDKKDAALIAFIEAVNATGGLRELALPEAPNHAIGQTFSFQDEPDWGEFSAAYLLACEAMSTEPLIERLPETQPILSVDIYVNRTVEDELSDKENEAEALAAHDLAATFPEYITKVSVRDKHGEFLYYADEREGDA